VNAKIWDVEADVFAPCAASRIITEDQANRMINAGLKLIAPGANVPFADPEIFFGKIADHVDNTISLIPDFIANLGIARVFAYLMSNDLDELIDEEIYADIRKTIDDALMATHKVNNNTTKIAKTSFEIILNQLI
jgi:glutamate dehydrogenase/leucine dehydrogenase